MANLSAREVNALCSHFSKVGRVLAGVPIRVMETNDGELGYTTPEDSTIYLAFHHDMFKTLTKGETVSFIKGVFTHELMHRIATNFNIYTRAIDTKKDYEQETMSSIINVMEDSSIEFQAPDYVSDDYVHCLDFVRAKISQLSPEIGEAGSPFGQFFRACIQFGDTGFLNGNFTSNEARDIFYKALPIMDNAVEELSPSKRAQSAEKVFELSRPLWEQEAKDKQAFMDLLKKLMKEHGTAKEDSRGSRHGTPSAMPSSGKPSKDESDDGESGSGSGSGSGSERGRDKRRKVTYREVSRKEFEKAKEEAEKNGDASGASADGDVEVLYTREPAATDGAGKDSGKEKPTSSKADDHKNSKKPENPAGDGKEASGKKEEPGEKTDGASGPSSRREKSDGESEENAGASSGAPKTDEEPGDEGAAGKDSKDGKTGDTADKGDSSDGSDPGKDAADSRAKGGEPGDESKGSGTETDEKDDAHSSSGGDASTDGGDSRGEQGKDGQKEGTRYGDDQDLKVDSTPHGPHEMPDTENASPEMTMREAAESLEKDLELLPEDVDAIIESIEHEVKELEQAKTKNADFDEMVYNLPVASGYKDICKNARCLNVRVTLSRGAAQEKYNEEVSKMASDITHLTNELMRIFKQKREEQLYRASGKLSVKRLSSGRMTPRVFTKRKDPSSAELAVAVAIDISGSMRGTKIINARKCGIALAEVFGRLNIPAYMFGFTADEEGCDAVHYHYLNWSNRPADRPRLLCIQARSNNFDGYSIRYAAELLKKMDSEHKLLIVISDGAPACVRYCGLNNNGITDVKLAIREASKQATVIGVLLEGDNPAEHREMYGYNFIDCQDSHDLFTKLGKAVARQVKEWD